MIIRRDKAQYDGKHAATDHEKPFAMTSFAQHINQAERREAEKDHPGDAGKAAGTERFSIFVKIELNAEREVAHHQPPIGEHWKQRRKMPRDFSQVIAQAIRLQRRGRQPVRREDAAPEIEQFERKHADRKQAQRRMKTDAERRNEREDEECRH